MQRRQAIWVATAQRRVRSVSPLTAVVVVLATRLAVRQVVVVVVRLVMFVRLVLVSQAKATQAA